MAAGKRNGPAGRCQPPRRADFQKPAFTKTQPKTSYRTASPGGNGIGVAAMSASRNRRRKPVELSRVDWLIIRDLRQGAPIDRAKPAVARAIRKYQRLLLDQHHADRRAKGAR